MARKTMQLRPARLGLPVVPPANAVIEGGLHPWRGDTWYRIDGHDAMEPFLTTVVSDGDLWMYVASTGGLTAGRTRPEGALFPYETVDRLFHSHTHTGPVTVIRALDDDAVSVWEPFSGDGRLRWMIHRAMLRHLLGCEVWFEERNASLGLTFRYGWRPSRRFGWVRSAELVNDTPRARRIELLDGVRNILPAGVGTALQDSFSCLVDAYKKTEASPGSSLARYRLTANIIDRAEASEALRVTVAWRAGLPGASLVLDASRREDFIRGRMPAAETTFNGRRGSYLVADALALDAGATVSWHIVLDTPVDHAGVAALSRVVAHDAGAQIEADITAGRERLRRFLAAADAFQATGDPLASAHHVSNVLFNIARGGVLPDHYAVDRADLARVVAARNRPAATRHAAWLSALPARLTLPDLQARAAQAGDRDLARICAEYLPLVFSRRHGDPSRPWNRFSIAVDDPDGTLRHAYEGNWRDIFQNWEALCRSFPECIEPVIARFVNASTMDGFNPYRITHEGIDWEVADPDNPWSSIGYWGDHQVVYLTRLLEASAAHHPGRLAAWLGARAFSYADVPYDMLPHRDIVAHPQKTVVFNRERQRAVDARVAATGTDGRLVHDGDAVLHVTLAEKLLVPILAKVSSLVPGGGVWMNTMRPEWNDANNALVGNGMSVVTACHLHRHLGVCADLVERAETRQVEVSSSVAQWMADVDAVFAAHGEQPTDARGRRAWLDAAGAAFERHRARVYAAGPGAATTLAAADIARFLRRARGATGATIAANRRPDRLYHAYNILHLGDGTAEISRLDLMLEGQVAALGSGVLTPREADALLAALRASALYRADQHSYLLYPLRALPDFGDTNRVPDSILARAPVLAARVAAGDRGILARDAGGVLRFHPDLHNADALRARFDDGLPAAERAALLDVYEEVFRHRSFTGRSGTMYRYEGIGCIYWHMVAKLVLAAAEAMEEAIAAGADDAVVASLRSHHRDLRAGLGFTKTPAIFGAFPLDPYSHTPGFGAASQPGMTGQVKEEILARWLELGVRVDAGCLVLDPMRVDPSEFLPGNGELAFTYCQVPVVYAPGDGPAIVVQHADGREERAEGTAVPAALSARVFARTGEIAHITVLYRR